MKTLRSAVAVFWATSIGISPASAHRLDEYLQATVIDPGRDHVMLRLRLTPGVDVADRVIARIDTNRDGMLSVGEKRAYALQIAKDLSVSLNGTSVTLRPEGGVFPTIAAMKAGTGIIMLQFESKAIRTKAYNRLIYSNSATGPDVVYLVNCLMPADPAVHIDEQTRSANQASYEVSFSIRS